MKFLKVSYLTICGIIFLFLGNLAHLLLPDVYWIHEPFHSSIEATGALCALILAVLILLIRKYNTTRFFYVWIVCGLTSMGFLDLLHAFVDPGESFVWLHSTATFMGGLFFVMVWLPERVSLARYTSTFPKMVFITTCIVGIISIALPDLMPGMLLGEGSFTQSAHLINFLGGLFFLAASLWFFKAYRRNRSFDEILFAMHSLLFGVAGILFTFSELWDIGWWLWHMVRVAAYSIALYYGINVYKQMTEAIHSERDKAQTYLDVSASILIVIDTSQDVILINRKGCEILGYTEDEIIGRNWFDTFLPERKKSEGKSFFETLVAGKTDQYVYSESPVLTKKGDERIIAWRITLLRDEKGDINSLLSSGEDITERKKVEEELQKAHEQLEKKVAERTYELEKANLLLNQEIVERNQAEQTLQKEKEKLQKYLDISAAIVVVIDSDQKVTLINKKGCEILGYGEEDILGKNWFENFIPERLRDEARRVHGKIISGDAGIIEYYENEVLTRDGRERVIAWYNTVFRDEAGNIVATLSTGGDITEHKKMENALRISEEQFREAFETAAIGIALVSPEGHWLRVNRALCEIVGYREPELLTLTFQDITYPDDLEADLNYVHQMLAGEIPYYHMEKRYIHKKGHIIWILLSVSLVRNENGEPLHFISQIQDITDRKNAEVQTRKSLKEKEVLLQEIHHRVKNNMTVIYSLLQLQAGKVRDERYREMFNESMNRIKTMALIHEKLYRSQDLTKILFSDYIRDMVDDIYVSYGTSPHKVKLKKDIARITLGIDTSIPCGLIVNELVSNSLKYAFPDGKGGEIRVSLHKNGKNEVELTVGDNGIGMPEKLNFRDTDSLGLNLVTTLVRQLQGTIELHSEGGTEFRITFKRRA